MTLVRCQPARWGAPKQPAAPQQQAAQKTPHLFRVERTEFRDGNEVVIHTRPISEPDALNTNDESVIDTNDVDAVHDYVTYIHPDKKVEKITVTNGDTSVLSVPVQPGDHSPARVMGTPGVTSIPIPPLGARMDNRLTPLAPPTASRQQPAVNRKSMRCEKWASPNWE